VSTSRARTQTDRIQAAQTYLDEHAAELATCGLMVDTGVPYGDAAGWIVAEVVLRRSDLVVMSTHHRGGPKRWVRGSVSESVVRHADVPVFLVRAENGVLGADVLLKSRRTSLCPWMVRSSPKLHCRWPSSWRVC